MPVQKTLTVGAPGRGICSMLSFYIVPMVPSSVLILAIGAKRSTIDVFSLGETICFRSIEFITNRFGGLSLSPLRDRSGLPYFTKQKNNWPRTTARMHHPEDHGSLTRGQAMPVSLKSRSPKARGHPPNCCSGLLPAQTQAALAQVLV
jgi:hypothetical protein